MKAFHEAASIESYSIISLQKKFYVFGGRTDVGDSNTICTFDTITKKWKKTGELLTARMGHGVIALQERSRHDNTAFVELGL